jgi:peptidoglycan hydrolase-like protein with peptidoglycan-binding domain
MARTLHLTTPLMRGDDVREAQKRLRGSNAFRTNYQPGAIDGQYGPSTARAAKRAKFWLGYPAGADGSYDDRLRSYLAGKTLPLAYRARRAARLRAKPATPIREKALANLRKKIGTKESPAGSNRCWASLWYGLIGPWCAMSAGWSYAEAGSKTLTRATMRAHGYAYVPALVADARLGRNGLAVTHDPKPGDLATYDWNGDGVADHVGLFEEWLNEPDTFQAVEGNTAVGNDSNGGEVMRRQRSRSDLLVFIHVAN